MITTPESITMQQVKAVLTAQVNGIDVHLSNSLEALTLVNQIVFDPAFPKCSYANKFVLVEILSALIRDELLRHRQVMGISDALPDRTRDEVFEAIARDQQTGNRELLGWSWLYYGYLRVDLCIQMKAFAQACYIDERTLRRYQECAMTRLTAILIKREWQARSQKTAR